MAHDVDANLSILVVHLDVFQSLNGVEQRNTATSHNTFLNRSTGCRKGIFHTMLLFFQLGLSGSTHTDNCHAT